LWRELDKFIFAWMKTEDLLKLLLPEYLVEYFDIIKAFEEGEELLHIEFEEKNTKLLQQ